MKALLVIDAQNAIVEFKDFQKELLHIELLIKDFKKKGLPVIFIRNLADEVTSPFHKEALSSELHPYLRGYADYVIEKKTPSSFFETKLDESLKELDVRHVFISGFNTKFCCQFTAIAAYDRGYHVTFIENATGTVNDDEVYEMTGLDIREFVGTVLHWSNVIEVLDLEEYEEEYI